tara:strand:- start:487 stop:690 length:204 start_codon:yes stop_codon:yes gene_type:complete
MGKVKEMAMDNEDKWFDIAGSKIGGCETIAEFMIAMEPHRDLMAHFTDRELDELQCDAWDNFWAEKL